MPAVLLCLRLLHLLQAAADVKETLPGSHQGPLQSAVLSTLPTLLGLQLLCQLLLL